MERNLCAGDKWIPGTIMERTVHVPLSYLVQVAEDKRGNIILTN